MIEWKNRVGDIWSFRCNFTPHYRNGKRVIQHFRELAEFIKTHEPAMHQWMMTYLEKHRNEIFLKWWSTHVSEWAKDHAQRFPTKKLHPDAKEEWDRIFGNDPATSFASAKRITLDIHNLADVKKCDNPAILAIHEGKECDDDMWDCSKCDTQEHDWKTELQQRLLHSSHPLLNVEKTYKDSTWKYNDIMNTLGDWAPPHFWGDIYDENYKEIDCYDFEEYIEYMRKIRQKDYGKKGQTPMKAIDTLLSLTCHYGGWDNEYHKNYKTEYEIFILLWNKLDLIPLSMELDLERIRQIEEMY
jgi:hypothetical protein